MLTRRRFIGLVGIGAISSSLLGFRFFKLNSPLLASIEFKNFSKRHATIMLSVFSSILAVNDEKILLNSLQKADQLLSHFDPWARLELMGALEVLEQSPLWAIGSIKRYSALDEEGQIQVLKKWATGFKPARALTQGLKEFSVFVYYSQDQSWNEIGYAGPLVNHK